MAKVVAAWQSEVGSSATTAKFRVPPFFGVWAAAGIKAAPLIITAADAVRTNVRIVNPLLRVLGMAATPVRRGYRQQDDQAQALAAQERPSCSLRSPSGSADGT